MSQKHLSDAEVAAEYTEKKNVDRKVEHTDVTGPTVAISIRLPDKQLRILKEFARRQGVGYQVLIKQWLDERIHDEHKKMHEAAENPAVYARTLLSEAVASLPEKRIQGLVDSLKAGANGDTKLAPRRVEPRARRRPKNAS